MPLPPRGPKAQQNIPQPTSPWLSLARVQDALGIENMAPTGGNVSTDVQPSQQQQALGQWWANQYGKPK